MRKPAQPTICCHLMKFLARTNKQLSKLELEMQEVTESVYHSLEERKKLCKKCR